MVLYFAISLLPFLAFVSTTTFAVGPNVTIGSNYRIEVGIARVGTPMRKLKVSVGSISCMLECNDLTGCTSFNLICNGVGSDDFQCELFDKSVRSHDKVKMESATYYEASTNKRDCGHIIRGVYPNNRRNGVYILALPNSQLINGVCDMQTADGGWTTLQRRFIGSVDFYRDWESYKHGFGDLNGEFWLGLENAHHLMKGTNTTLRFDIWDGTDHYYQEYYDAVISDENDSYKLSFHGTSGTAGDSLSAKSKDRMFTTKDRDSDENVSKNCANLYHGAWWYGKCHDANLNGKYGDNSFGKGMNWKTITGHTSSLSKTEIKVKRIC